MKKKIIDFCVNNDSTLDQNFDCLPKVTAFFAFLINISSCVRFRFLSKSHCIFHTFQVLIFRGQLSLLLFEIRRHRILQTMKNILFDRSKANSRWSRRERKEEKRKKTWDWGSTLHTRMWRFRADLNEIEYKNVDEIYFEM